MYQEQSLLIWNMFVCYNNFKAPKKSQVQETCLGLFAKVWKHTGHGIGLSNELFCVKIIGCCRLVKLKEVENGITLRAYMLDFGDDIHGTPIQGFPSPKANDAYCMFPHISKKFINFPLFLQNVYISPYFRSL